jgi:FAD:protein FMN transferase
VISTRRFKAMGTEMELLVDAAGAEAALDAAEAEIHRLEAIMTRFRADSELSRLNRDGTIDASPDLLRVVELALDARTRTGGKFDPTVHDALVSAGYDRTFSELQDGPPPVPSRAGGGVRIAGTEIQLEPGVRLDLGGIGKGFAAERSAEILATAGPCLVNAGGDIAVRGGAWTIGIEHLTVELTHGGVATSGRDRRVWRRAGREQHHLIDPCTGLPARSHVLRVTVVAGDAVEAEVAAKSVFLGGTPNLPGVVVTDDGCTTIVGGLA